MMRSSAYNRFGVLMGTSWPTSCPRWFGVREDSSPMITLFLSQGDFCATASRHTSRGHVSTHSQEERHGPHDCILPQWALPYQRPNWYGQYRYPCAEGAALPLLRVSQNLQRPQRDCRL